MKKKVLLSMALLSAAVVAGSTPVISQAAEVKTSQIVSNKCYKVFVGWGCESLAQLLSGICNSPETPVPPVVETPDAQEPESNVPENNVPENNVPEINVPDQETLSYAEQVVKLVNEERAKAGLPALTVDADITAAANVRAKEIVQNFSHTRPNGSSFSSVLKEQGVSFRGSGENIAWGQKTPEQVMNGWMNSDGHRANILNQNYKNIGVGYYQDENGVNYWVQLFTY